MFSFINSLGVANTYVAINGHKRHKRGIKKQKSNNKSDLYFALND